MRSACQDSNGGLRPGAIVGGGFLLVVGGTMFLERAGIADVSFARVIGPACLIVLGMLLLVGSPGMPVRRRRGLSGGLWLVGVGCWMLISHFQVLGLDYRTSWPLLVILSGIIMLVRGAR